MAAAYRAKEERRAHAAGPEGGRCERWVPTQEHHVHRDPVQCERPTHWPSQDLAHPPQGEEQGYVSEG